MLDNHLEACTRLFRCDYVFFQNYGCLLQALLVLRIFTSKNCNITILLLLQYLFINYIIIDIHQMASQIAWQW